MSYKIKEVKVEGDTLNTVVEYTFKDGSVSENTISHFMPADKAEVILGIENREVSEQRKLDATVTNEEIKKEIDANVA